LEEARKLLAAGRPFHAHEVLEARWKTGPAEERELWQGLAQICVGLTHIQRGNLSGAAALLTRGSARLGAYGSTRPYRLDLRALAIEADAVTTAIDEGNADAGSAIAAILARLTPGE
jgi:predicted metal-dependent hydrolase